MTLCALSRHLITDTAFHPPLTGFVACDVYCEDNHSIIAESVVGSRVHRSSPELHANCPLSFTFHPPTHPPTTKLGGDRCNSRSSSSSTRKLCHINGKRTTCLPVLSVPYPPLLRETRTPMLRLRVTAPVESVGDVYHAVSGCNRLSEEFTADGSIVLRVAVELGQVSCGMVVPRR